MSQNSILSESVSKPNKPSENEISDISSCFFLYYSLYFSFSSDDESEF